ncbi:DUF4349 domain-containing protein [Chryseobacterium caseinilyticum]|uniref:DUF4349 domain-containing protein n=1 Tax=Chryseobacterium caseinilyticum TaxID=2771428 RepID=A0ABR8Z8Z9_9FLAO|nr:DUF4349 domain-containing protein [Chryseobacterium caseinilyticum]MBD8081251.1 DUF4349 domain-containing protein [Chryseobacterium caseinilyticum]
MKKILIALMLTALISCSKKEGEIQEEQIFEANLEEIKDMPASATANSAPQRDAVAASSDGASENKAIESQPLPKVNSIVKKIIKNGEMTVQVGDITKSQSQIQSIVKNNQAYIQKETFRNSDMRDEMEFTIRVPHQQFESLINSFSDGFGTVTAKNIYSDDVTEEYVDISIKLENKKIYLEKYRDMLKSAKSTSDMLEIQENIRNLEDEIDVSEGRLKFIDDRVKYSTLNLTLFKEKVRSSTTSKVGFGSRFADSLTEGWNGFVAFLLGLISLWPFFILIPIVIIIWRNWKKSRTKK